jgi:transposase
MKLGKRRIKKIPGRCNYRAPARQLVANLRDVFDGLRWIVRSGAPWRYLPADFQGDRPYEPRVTGLGARFT